MPERAYGPPVSLENSFTIVLLFWGASRPRSVAICFDISITWWRFAVFPRRSMPDRRWFAQRRSGCRARRVATCGLFDRLYSVWSPSDPKGARQPALLSREALIR